MSQQDAPLNIETPENVAFVYDIAGIGSRFLACMVDSAIIVVLQIIMFFMMYYIVDITSSPGAFLESITERNTWMLAIAGLLSFLILWGYYIFFETIWNGQSPGKRWAKLRVIRRDGTPVTISETLIRNIVRLVDFLPFNYAVGVVIMFITENSQRLGDLAAGTLVVRDNQEQISLESLKPIILTEPVQPYHPYIEGYGELPIEVLDERDIHLAREFLERSRSGDNLEVVGEKILNNILAKMELRPVSYKQVNVTGTLKSIVVYSEYLKIISEEGEG